MKLLYMWIEQFRNIKNQGFVIDNEYIVEIDNPDDSVFQYYSEDGMRIYYSGDSQPSGRKVYERSIIIRRNLEYRQNTSTDPIDSIAVLVGENATGKSSILECLSSRCDQATYRNDEKYYFLVFFNAKDNSVIVRTRDIWLTNYGDSRRDRRRTDGYEEFVVTLNGSTNGLIKQNDISNHFCFSLMKDIGVYDAYRSMGLPTVRGNLNEFTFRNSFEGIYRFLSDFNEFGGQDNTFVLYLEDEDVKRNRVPYFERNEFSTADYKYYFKYKLAQILFENLRKYLFRPEREYSAAGTLLYPSPEQDEQLSLEYMTSGEILSFTNLRDYPHHPSRGRIMLSRSITNIDFENSLLAAFEFFRNCTFIYGGARKSQYNDYLTYLEKLFHLIDSLDESHFVAFYKAEIPFKGKAEDLIHTLQYLLSDYQLDEKLTEGIIVDFEWLSAGESQFSLLFSAIYQRLSKRFDGFENRHIILSIDEPEMHMHPEIGRIFLDKLNLVLRSFKQKSLLTCCQVILATHSPFIIQELSNYTNSIALVKKEKGQITIHDFANLSQLILPNHKSYSFNLVMYKIFGVPSIELHNELYGVLQEVNQLYSIMDYKDRNTKQVVTGIDTWLKTEIPQKDLVGKQWIPERDGVVQQAQNVTLQTYIRNSIHHPENRQNTDLLKCELQQSIEQMISLLW